MALFRAFLLSGIVTLALGTNGLWGKPATVCCFCTTKTVDKIHLGPYTPDCEERSGKYPFESCEKINVLEETCSLIKIETVKGARKCVDSPINYFDKSSKKVQLHAPSEALQDCKSLTVPNARLKTNRQDEEIDPCQEYFDAFCANIQPGEGRQIRCLQAHRDALSDACRADRNIQ